MPVGVDLDHDHEETRPVNGQRHEPWNESRAGNPARDESAGAVAARLPATARPRRHPMPGRTPLRRRSAPAMRGQAAIAGSSRAMSRRRSPSTKGVGRNRRRLRRKTRTAGRTARRGRCRDRSASPSDRRTRLHEPWDAAMGAAAELAAALRDLQGRLRALGREREAKPQAPGGSRDGRRLPGLRPSRPAGPDAVPGHSPARPHPRMGRAHLEHLRPDHRRLRARGHAEEQR